MEELEELDRATAFPVTREGATETTTSRATRPHANNTQDAREGWHTAYPTPPSLPPSLSCRPRALLG